jgi:hydroxylamine reductase
MLFRASATRLLTNMSRQLTAQKPSPIFILSQAVIPTNAAQTAIRSMTATPASQITNPAMFCRQCEQTQDHVACRTVGICGKSAETSAMQDGLVHALKSVGMWAVAAREAGATSDEMYEANWWTLRSAFSTLTNVNFDEERIADFIREGLAVKKNLEKLVNAKGGKAPAGSVASALDFSETDTASLEEFGYTVSVPKLKDAMGNDDCFSLVEIATYGAKGVCAYAAHCHQLGRMDEEVMAGLHEIFAKLACNEADMDSLLANVLRVGELNGKVLAMLDDAHASSFGVPEPIEVKVTATEGKAILVSGHDLKDLEELLKQTEGTGVNVYTHGEMLPAHSYPGLKKYSHLVGNYGTAWQAQKFEFSTFPGPIVVTTNCILEPRRMYKDRIYSMNEVGVSGVKHLGSRDFSEVIAKAKACKGFPKTINPPQFHTVGFNHRAVLPLAGEVIKGVKKGDISRIFLIGGCDGSQFDRNYFTELAEELPDNTLILTLGCAKNRFIHSQKLLNQTLANGMPRIMDMGQCNDSYSAIVVATELAKALNCSVNDLPLSLCLSHLEQKAAAVLLTLLNMGVKNIRLGPSLPAYITPNVLNVLVENYNLMPTGNVQDDIQGMMAGQ